MSELNVGDEVMMINDELHAEYPENYPAKGSIGVVVEYSSCDETALVDWGQDSGVDSYLDGEYAWWCSVRDFVKVNANTQVNTQKEVCNMSKFKVGDKVVFTNAKKHETVSQFYPAVGTVGIVKEIDTGTLGKNSLLVDWNNAEGVDVWEDGTKSWWCNEDDVKPFCEVEPNYTDGEVWEMLKPKMNQFVPVRAEDIDMSVVKKMVVAAYRSGYGRATKGRSFMIKPKVDEKPSIEKRIEAVLSDKRLVTFYDFHGKQSYIVSNFTKAVVIGNNTEIHNIAIYKNSLYNSLRGSVGGNNKSTEGFDYLYRTDCEMYVAIPFSEAVEQFDSGSIKVLYCGCGGKYRIKPWAIGKFSGIMRFGNKTNAAMTFKCEGSNSLFYPEIHSPSFKALVPICDYLKHEGVNV